MAKLTFSIRLPAEVIARVDAHAPNMVAPGMPTPSRSEVIEGLVSQALDAYRNPPPSPSPEKAPE